MKKSIINSIEMLRCHLFALLTGVFQSGIIQLYFWRIIAQEPATNFLLKQMLSCQRYRGKGSDCYDADSWSEGEALQSTNKNSYGCLFCRSGQEEATANKLRTLYPEIEYIVP